MEMVLLYGKLERMAIVTTNMDKEAFEETIANTVAPQDPQAFVDRYCTNHERLKGKRFQLPTEEETCLES